MAGDHSQDARRSPERLPAPIPAEERSRLILFDQPRPERNPAAVYLQRLGSDGSRRVMRDALNVIAAEALGVPPRFRVGSTAPAAPSPDATASQSRMARSASRSGSRRRGLPENVTYLYCDWSALHPQHTRAIREWLDLPTGAGKQGESSYAPATINRLLAALRGVLKEAWRLGKVGDDDYAAAVRALGTVSASPRAPRGRSPSPGELAALLACCRQDDEYYRRFPRRQTPDTRDAALITTHYSVGLRRGQIVALDLADYDRESRVVRVRSASPRPERQGLLAGEAERAMRDWLAVRGSSPGPLFCSILKSGQITGRRLSDQAVYAILRARQRQAHVPPFSPLSPVSPVSPLDPRRRARSARRQLA